MNTIRSISMLSLAILGACAASSTPSEPRSDPDGAVVVRPSSGVPVSGTSFACSPHPASVRTPCDEFSRPQSGTAAADRGLGIVELGLSRSSNEVDGGSVSAQITLTYLLEDDRDGDLVVTAQQLTVFEALPGFPRQDASAGWIEPVAEAFSTAGRNAGRFSLTFDWGTMSGTYDTDDRP